MSAAERGDVAAPPIDTAAADIGGLVESFLPLEPRSRLPLVLPLLLEPLSFSGRFSCFAAAPVALLPLADERCCIRRCGDDDSAFFADVANVGGGGDDDVLLSMALTNATAR